DASAKAGPGCADRLAGGPAWNTVFARLLREQGSSKDLRRGTEELAGAGGDRRLGRPAGFRRNASVRHGWRTQAANIAACTRRRDHSARSGKGAPPNRFSL